MNETNRNHLGLLASGILACLSTTAGAQIFTEDFNGYAGNQNNTQGDTGLNVAHSGNVAGWSTSGTGTMHAVDFGSSDWAIMFWQDNVITQTVGIAANDSGTSYEVTFDFGTADYAGGQGTEAGDQLLVEVLRGDNSVLASDTFTPGAWGAGNYNLDAGLLGTLPYVGDGTGDVRLRIGPAPGTLNQGRFAGEIDNISVSDVTPGAISITSFIANPSTLADSEDAVTFDWTVTGMPLDSLEITPGNIDVLGDTDGGTGVGSYELDPGPDGTTEYTLTATKGGDTATRMVTVTLPAPVIDLTGVAGAQLTFAEALDIEAGDTAVVNIIEELTDTVIAAAVYTADDSGSNSTADWKNVTAIDLAAGFGQKVRIEWCFTGFGGTTDDYLGWYVDDVVVTETAP